MEDNLFRTDEDVIAGIIESHREEAFGYAREQMHEAFDRIGEFLAKKGFGNLSRRKINGIEHSTLKELYRLHISGRSSIDAPEETRKRWFTEFVKAQSLSFEIQRAKYPNFLKPWTEEDDDKLERLWCEGVSEKELSRILMRHPNGISARIARLELVEKYGERGIKA